MDLADAFTSPLHPTGSFIWDKTNLFVHTPLQSVTWDKLHVNKLPPKWIITWSELSGNKHVHVSALAEFVYLVVVPVNFACFICINLFFSIHLIYLILTKFQEKLSATFREY